MVCHRRARHRAPDAERSQIVELGGRTVVYAYDDAQRLISEIITGGSPNGTISYSYDAVGNRLSRTSTVTGISASSATYDANDRLIGTTYDDNGNTLSAGGISIAYDGNHMTEAISEAIAAIQGRQASSLAFRAPVPNFAKPCVGYNPTAWRADATRSTVRISPVSSAWYALHTAASVC